MTNYLEQYKQIHSKADWFGSGACFYLEEVCAIIDYLRPKTVLDYGCGKGNLIDALEQLYPHIRFYKYDPAIEGISVLPVDKVDLVLNTDVLEHIPEDILESVVAEISSLSNNAFFALHHALACTILPNGENAHCTVKPPIWYYNLFSKYYNTPYPLPGRKVELSAMITFTPSIKFLQQYDAIIKNRKINKKDLNGFYKILKAKKVVDTEEKILYKHLQENKSKKIVLWGASEFLRDFLEKYEIQNDVYIVDKDFTKTTQAFGKYSISPVDSIDEIKPDIVICTIKNNSKKVYLSIKKELKERRYKGLLLKNIFK